MIIGERKPLEQILEMLSGYHQVLNIGCGGCTSICLAGGQKEVGQLNRELLDLAENKQVQLNLSQTTIERQCNADFFTDLDRLVTDFQAIVSMACGAGVQFVAERYPKIPVFPALNTVFVGVDRDVGWYEENCRTCGDCVLGETGGICPVTRCAKSLFNGPCGGTTLDCKCEVSKDVPCAWYEIHNRLKEQGRLANITQVKPAREWVNQTQRTLIQEPYKQRYAK